jgi:TPR repeat protein
MRFGVLIALFCCSAMFFIGWDSQACAQGKADSPVFKKYRPPPEPPLVEPSDAMYQIWQTFLVTRKANAGDVLAQHELSIRYLLGRGVAADTAKGAYWTKRAADQDYIPARFNYGILTYHGWGTPWDPFEAYRQFLSCAGHRMPEAEYIMAQFLTENLVVPRDFEAAYTWVKASADSGYAPAKEAVIRMERQGIGKGKPDSVLPASKLPNTGLVFLDFMADTSSVANDSLLLREAVNSASPAVRKALGMGKMVEEGGRTDSATLAAVRQAAEGGSPEALVLLGRSYEKGNGVPRDIVKACAFYVRAIRLDSPGAGELLWKLLQEKGTVAHIRSAADRGDPEAEFAWAGFLALGFEMPLIQGQAFITGDQAFQLLQKAGEKGFTPALVETGLCHYAGRWVPQNNEKALRAWTLAAEKGSSDAMVRIALTSLKGTEDTTGRTQAIALLLQAAEQGSVLAEVGLGFCYETGTGEPVSKAEAARYYRAASVRGSQDAFRALRRMHDAVRPEEKEYQIRE